MNKTSKRRGKERSGTKLTQCTNHNQLKTKKKINIETEIITIIIGTTV